MLEPNPNSFPEAATRKADPAARVTVTGIDIPFGDVVVLMVKWSFAAIPAMIIIVIIWSVVGAMLAGLLRGH